MFSPLLRLSATLLACSFTYSCTFLKTTPQSLNDNIDQWLAFNQYDKIDYALNKIDPQNPRFKNVLKRKPSIKQKQKLFIDKTSRAARKFKSEFKWQQALNTYDDALGKLNDHPRLIKERQALISQRDEHVNNLRKDLLMDRANALISYKNTYSTLKKLLPDDNNAQNDINRYEDEKEHLASQLQKCGEHALRNNQYILARDCYLLSNKLKPSDKKLSFVDSLEKQLKTQADNKRFKELFSAYEVAYNKKNYHKARTPLQALIAIKPDHKKANALLKNLNAEIDEHIETLISSGKTLYSAKKINEALKIWKQAKELAPNNKELSRLIIRAEKVSKKLQRLEHGQSN